MRKSLKYIYSGLLFILFFAGCLFFIELYIASAEIESLSNFEVDPVYGKRLLPERNMLYINEGFHIGKTNKYRYLGPAYPPEKDTNTYRIALIGDSFIEAFQVFDRNSLRADLEKDLKIITGKEIEVLNFGRSGFTFSDMFVYYKTFCKDFQSDITLFFLEESDFTDDSHQYLMPGIRQINDQIVTDFRFRNSTYMENYLKTKWLRENSALLKMANNCIKVLPNKKIVRFMDTFLSQKKSIKSEQLHKKNIPGLTSLNLQVIKELKQDNSVSLVFIGEMSDTIRKQIDSTGFAYIDMLKPISSLKESGFDPYYWKATSSSGHWNPETQQKLGQFLAHQLANKLLHND